MMTGKIFGILFPQSALMAAGFLSEKRARRKAYDPKMS